MKLITFVLALITDSTTEEQNLVYRDHAACDFKKNSNHHSCTAMMSTVLFHHKKLRNTMYHHLQITVCTSKYTVFKNKNRCLDTYAKILHYNIKKHKAKLSYASLPQNIATIGKD